MLHEVSSAGDIRVRISRVDSSTGTTITLRPLDKATPGLVAILERAAKRWAYQLLPERDPRCECQVDRSGDDVTIFCRPFDRAAFLEAFGDLSERIQLEAAHQEAADAVLAVDPA